MRSIFLSLSSLISASFFVTMSNAAITTMIGVLVAGNGGQQSEVALIAACYSIGFLAGCFIVPAHIQRIGFIRAFAAGAGMLTIAIVAMDMSDSIWVWAGLRLLMGFSVAATTAVADSWINGNTPNDKRGRVIAVYAIILGLASIASQLAFLFLDSGDDGFVLLFAIAMNIALVLVALTSSVPPESPQTSPKAFAGWSNVSTVASLGAFTSGFVRAGIFAMIPFYLTSNGVSENVLALLIAMIYSGRLVFQWPIGLISDRFDRRSVLIGLSASVCVLMLVMMLPSEYEGRYVSGEVGLILQVLTFLAALMLGGTLFPMYSVSSSLAFDRAEGRSMVEVSTSLLIAYSVGSIVGPFTIMLTSKAFGDTAFQICAFVVCALTAVVGLTKRATVEGPAEHTPSAATRVPDTSVEMAQVAAEQADDSIIGADEPELEER